MYGLLTDDLSLVDNGNIYRGTIVYKGEVMGTFEEDYTGGYVAFLNERSGPCYYADSNELIDSIKRLYN